MDLNSKYLQNNNKISHTLLVLVLGLDWDSDAGDVFGVLGIETNGDWGHFKAIEGVHEYDSHNHEITYILWILPLQGLGLTYGWLGHGWAVRARGQRRLRTPEHRRRHSWMCLYWHWTRGHKLIAVHVTIRTANLLGQCPFPVKVIFHDLSWSIFALLGILSLSNNGWCLAPGFDRSAYKP